jgi:cell division protein FtsB
MELNLNESFWKNVKFFLLFVLMASLLYIILTKYMLRIPIADNQKLLSAITAFEKVNEKEKETALKIDEKEAEVKALEFDIYQVQKQDDIKRGVKKIRETYLLNDNNSKYKFSLQASRLLRLYYDTREKNSTLIHNTKLLSENLTKCEAKI